MNTGFLSFIICLLFLISAQSVFASTDFDQQKDEQKKEEPNTNKTAPEQQIRPYPFMPSIFQTMDMFQKAMESMDNKIGYTRKEDSKVKVGGYIQTQFKVTAYTNEFNIKRARGKIFGNVTEDISYKLMVDAFSERILKDAYIDFNIYPLLNFRFGQFKVPFGLEGVESSTIILPINRSLVTTNLYQERDIGIEANGKSENNKFAYAVAVINGSGENTADRDNYKDVAARSGVYVFNLFTVGASGHWGRFYNSLLEDYQDKYRMGLDADYFNDYFKFTGEYIQGKNDTLNGKDNTEIGWYILFSSKYLYPFEPLIRYEYWDEGDSNIKQTTLGLNYYFIADTRLMLNYEMRNLLSGDNTFLAQVQIVF